MISNVVFNDSPLSPPERVLLKLFGVRCATIYLNHTARQQFHISVCQTRLALTIHIVNELNHPNTTLCTYPNASFPR
jgi:hypothetical protein